MSGFIDPRVTFVDFRSNRNGGSCLPAPKELVFSSWQYRLIGVVLSAYCICNRTVVCSCSVEIIEDQPVDSTVVSIQLSVGCTLGNCCSMYTGTTNIALPPGSIYFDATPCILTGTLEIAIILQELGNFQHHALLYIVMSRESQSLLKIIES